MKLIISCNNSPDYLLTMLQALNYESSDMRILGVGELLPKKVTQSIILILSYNDFILNLDALNGSAFKAKTVFLFAPVVRARHLYPATFLDVTVKRKDAIRLSFMPISEALLKGTLDQPFVTKPVNIRAKNYLTELIDNVKTGSLLNPLMTMIYSVKAGLQVKLKSLIFNWFFTEATIAELKDQLSEFDLQHKLTKNLRKSVIELAESDLGKQYKQAFIHIAQLKVQSNKDKKVVVSYKNIAKKYKLNAYELAYVCKITFLKIDTSVIGKSLHNIYYSRDRRSANKITGNL